MAKFGDDWLQLEDFYFSVDSGGIVRPEAQQGVNHGNYTEAETFYAHALTTTGQQCTLIFQLCFSNLGYITNYIFDSELTCKAVGIVSGVGTILCPRRPHACHHRHLFRSQL